MYKEVNTKNGSPDELKVNRAGAVLPAQHQLDRHDQSRQRRAQCNENVPRAIKRMTRLQHSILCVLCLANSPESVELNVRFLTISSSIIFLGKNHCYCCQKFYLCD